MIYYILLGHILLILPQTSQKYFNDTRHMLPLM